MTDILDADTETIRSEIKKRLEEIKSIMEEYDGY